MFRQPERRKFLDVADDRLGDVASIEQGFVEERLETWHGICGPSGVEQTKAHERHENEPSVQKLLLKRWSYSPCRQRACRSGPWSILARALCRLHCRVLTCERDDLALMVEHDMQFEAEKPGPCWSFLLPPGQ